MHTQARKKGARVKDAMSTLPEGGLKEEVTLAFWGGCIPVSRLNQGFIVSLSRLVVFLGRFPRQSPLSQWK